ncbi:Peptidase family M28 [Sinomicrobium oceani]|uniref:Peptidase family M28 n=1 Tax=Sinomicrobium oceani TaxID=1150368 RepID=A0A1K1NE06_9FLAO|nr:M20/M25/M40 family metallo-hydrolase [Sinomicrobium oceani]SFW33481.1 Peptidase family M28 [Sinomicrobium oceani]
MTTSKKVLCCSVLLFISSYFQSFAQDHTVRPDASIIQQHINVLAADKLKGRGTGSKGLKKAARYIEKEFKKYGLQPMGTRSYKQPFIAKVKRVVVKDSLRKANNIIGFLDNGAPYTVVIGAHYDHLGMGKQGGSKHPKPEGLIHNGADDNASGVAGLLELARYFSGNGAKEPYNVLFIAFSGEELGLLGSAYFVEHPVIPLQQIHFMLNMDMIGRYNPERGIGIGGYGTSSEWPSVFEGLDTTIKFFTDNAGSGGSDHGSFYAKQIPVLFFHTGGHPDYHMPSDDADKINAKAEAGIIDLEIQLIEHAMQKEKLPFTEVKS